MGSPADLLRAGGEHQVRQASGRHRPFTWAGRSRSASKTSRYQIIAERKRSPGTGHRSAQGEAERKRVVTEGLHCPDPVRLEALENWPAGKRKESGGNTDADGTVDGQCCRLEVPWNALCQKPHARQMQERER